MGKKKQIVLFILIFGLVVFISAMNFPAFSSGNQSWENLTVYLRGNFIKIFDPKTGTFYKYDDNRGKILKIWKIDELGKDLRRIKTMR